MIQETGPTITTDSSVRYGTRLGISGCRADIIRYQTITVVDPPYGADGAAGMEYPTFITVRTAV